MLCVTLTLAKNFPNAGASEAVDQLVASLRQHPDAVGGAVAGFKAVGERQVQGCLTSADETVGFVLSAARSGAWGVHLTLLSFDTNGQLPWGDENSIRPVLDAAAKTGAHALRAPGGVEVVKAVDNKLVGPKDFPELGPIESTLQLLCAIERRRSDEGQEAGLMINGGKSQIQAAGHLGVSQQAVSARLHAGYWYESRKVAYWLASQVEQVLAG